MNTANEPSVDASVSAMKSGRSKPLLIGVAVIVGVLGAGAAYTLFGKWSLASDLKSEGFTDVTVSIEGPFSYSFVAESKVERCKGSETRLPIFTTSSRGCVQTIVDEERPAPPPPPPRRNMRAELEASLAKNYKKHGLEKFACPEVGKEDTLSCTMHSSNGASVPITMTVTKRGADGLWSEWTMESAKRFIAREALANDLGESVRETFAKSGRAATPVVDCGAGVLVIGDAPIECAITTPDRPKPGKVTVTFEPTGGKYNMSVTGI